MDGSPSWVRTNDLRINSPSLYRLSYRGIEVEKYTQSENKTQEHARKSENQSLETVE